MCWTWCRRACVQAGQQAVPERNRLLISLTVKHPERTIPVKPRLQKAASPTSQGRCALREALAARPLAVENAQLV